MASPPPHASLLLQCALLVASSTALLWCLNHSATTFQLHTALPPTTSLQRTTRVLHNSLPRPEAGPFSHLSPHHIQQTSAQGLSVSKANGSSLPWSLPAIQFGAAVVAASTLLLAIVGWKRNQRSPDASMWVCAAASGDRMSSDRRSDNGRRSQDDLEAKVKAWNAKLAARRGSMPTPQSMRNQQPPMADDEEEEEDDFSAMPPNVRMVNSTSTKRRKEPAPKNYMSPAETGKQYDVFGLYEDVEEDAMDMDFFGAQRKTQRQSPKAKKDVKGKSWAAFEEEDDDDDAEDIFSVSDLMKVMDKTKEKKPQVGQVWSLGPGQKEAVKVPKDEFSFGSTQPFFEDDDDDDESLLTGLEYLASPPPMTMVPPSKNNRSQSPKKLRSQPAFDDEDEDMYDDDEDDTDVVVDKWDDAERRARLAAQVETYMRTHKIDFQQSGIQSPSASAKGGYKSKNEMPRQGDPTASSRIKSANLPLYILHGTAKGRKISSPPVYLRPMMSKVRQALFNSLISMGLFESGSGMTSPANPIKALDIFAGSGCIGLEALSRGASVAAFVDLSPECCKTVLANGQACGFSSNRTIAVQGDAMKVLRDPRRFREGEQLLKLAPFELVTMTPPYDQISYDDLLDAVCHSPLIGPDTVVVIEYPKKLKTMFTAVIGDRLYGFRNRRYGRTNLATYIYLPQSSLNLRPDQFA